MKQGNDVNCYFFHNIYDKEDIQPNSKRFKCDCKITLCEDRGTLDELNTDGDTVHTETSFDFLSTGISLENDWKPAALDGKNLGIKANGMLDESAQKRENNTLECRLRDLHIQKLPTKVDEWSVIIGRDEDGDNLLFIAIITLKTYLSKLLIDIAPSYGDLNVVNKLFQTALHLAALTGNYLVVRRLLVAGAKVDERDYRLNTPLHIAVGKGFIKVAKALMTPVTYLETKQNQYEIPYQKIPQNLEIFNAAGLTCLHVAGHNNDKPLLDLLLSNEADLNARELKSGKTLLHYFAEVDNIDMVKYLISKSRLILDKHTYCGITAAELAYSRCRFGIAYLLCSSGANDVMSQSVNYSDSENDSEN